MQIGEQSCGGFNVNRGAELPELQCKLGGQSYGGGNVNGRQSCRGCNVNYEDRAVRGH